MKECRSITGINIHGSTNGIGLIKNCDFYANLNTKYGCVSCKKGYRGILSDDGGLGYIDECTAFAECSANNVLNNIHSNVTSANYPFKTTYNVVAFDLNMYFNGCGSCATATNVLTAFVGPTLDPVMYDSATLSSVAAPVTKGKNLECLVPAATFGGVAFNFIANCAKALAVVF